MSKRDPHDLLPLTPAMFYVLVAMADGQAHGYAMLRKSSNSPAVRSV